MRLDTATAIYAGSEPVKRIMVGGVQVWPVATTGGIELRLYVDSTYGAPPTIANLQFKAGTTVLTGTPISSSDAGAANDAAKAFDGSVDTYWTPNGDLDAAPWIGLKLAEAATVSEVVIVNATIETLYTASGIAAFRVTNDGTAILTRTDEPEWSPGQTRSYTV